MVGKVLEKKLTSDEVSDKFGQKEMELRKARWLKGA